MMLFRYDTHLVGSRRSGGALAVIFGVRRVCVARVLPSMFWLCCSARTQFVDGCGRA